MRRVINAMISVGNRLLFLFDDPTVLRGLPPEAVPDSTYLTTLIERGQAEGVHSTRSRARNGSNTRSTVWSCGPARTPRTD